MANQKALMEEQFFKQAEADKKNMIKGILATGYMSQQAPKEDHLANIDMAEGDKITLQKRLELDNKLRQFNNTTQ